MNWTSYIKEYTLFLKIERGLSKNSIESYTRDIKKLNTFLEDTNTSIPPFSIGKDSIQQFIYEASKTINPRSQARLISSLRSFFDYLIFEEYRKDNPTDLIETPKIGRKLPDALSHKEIERLFSKIDLSHPQGERNRIILETIYGCGLRVSEVINLQLSDLFFEEDYIRILGKGNKYRFVPLHYTTKKHLQLYINQIRSHIDAKPEDFDTVFLNRRGGKLTRQMIFKILKDLSIKAQLDKNISPHTLRHSFATELIKNGADLRAVQQLLGHESITTTEIYVHLDTTHLQKVVNTFHPRK